MVNSYVWADGQILAKCDHTGASVEDYFYITDRSGSVRVIADDGGAAQVSYTYDPFGVVIEENGTFANPFKFTGQWFDEEISQYYLRARMYDPRLMRFTGYDPVRGGFKEPMTLHRFLYCENNPVNLTDISGAMAVSLMQSLVKDKQLEHYAKFSETAVREGQMTALECLATMADLAAYWQFGRNDKMSKIEFMEDLVFLFTEISGKWGNRGRGAVISDFGTNGQTGFAARYTEPQFPRSNQVRHFTGWMLAGFHWGLSAIHRLRLAEWPYGGTNTRADYLLGIEAIGIGMALFIEEDAVLLNGGIKSINIEDVGDYVRKLRH